MPSLKIATVELIPVSVPYRHREISSQVARDGVSDVLVKLTTDDGLVGWGEACCGADTASVEAALRAMTPFVVGRDPWNRDAMRRDVFTHGLWQFQAGTGNFAWEGVDMALWDICGRACGQPIWRLLGGLQQQEATYFYYLARATEESLRAQVDDGLETGFEVFYLKVGLDDAEDIAMVATVRDALGPGPLLRIDANGSWKIPQAVRNLQAMDEYDIDFVEQPVRDHPIGQLAELRARIRTAVCANEGLWSEADAHARIRAREADVYCFSSYWVGSLGGFHRLSWLAEEGRGRVPGWRARWRSSSEAVPEWDAPAQRRWRPRARRSSSRTCRSSAQRPSPRRSPRAAGPPLRCTSTSHRPSWSSASLS